MPIIYITDKPAVIGKISFLYHTQKESFVHPKFHQELLHLLAPIDKTRRH